MESFWTIRQTAEWIVGLGIGDPRMLERSDPYLEARCTDAYDVQGVLIGLGVLCLLDSEQFERVHERGLQVYCAQLQALSDTTRGKVTITDVAVDELHGDHLLRFRCNGEQKTWSIPHGPTECEDYDAFQVFMDRIADLTPASSPERWCGPVEPTTDDEVVYAYGDPAALRTVGERFGIRFGSGQAQ
ncbi:hypothetical protein [Nocardia sp. NPDC057030]|uniref:hypothetical protein n=1 Tax=unclassified Nocardia TaxID=2637762 RepID=UPI003637AABA